MALGTGRGGFLGDFQGPDRRQAIAELLRSFGGGMLSADPEVDPLGIGSGAHAASGALTGLREQRRERALGAGALGRELEERSERREGNRLGRELTELQMGGERERQRLAGEELSPGQQREQDRAAAEALADEVLSLLPADDARRTSVAAYRKLGDPRSIAALDRMAERLAEEQGAERRYRQGRTWDREETRRDIAAGVQRDPNAPPPQNPRETIRPIDLMRELRQRTEEFEGSLSDRLGLDLTDAFGGPLPDELRAQRGLPPLTPPAEIQQERAAAGQPPLSPQEYREMLRVDIRKRAREMARQSAADDLGVPVDDLPGLMTTRGGPADAGPRTTRDELSPNWPNASDEQVIAGFKAALAAETSAARAGVIGAGLSLVDVAKEVRANVDAERATRLLYGLGLALAGGNHQAASSSGILAVLGLE